MQLNLKEDLIKKINDIEVTNDFYNKVNRLIIDWHVVNSVSFTEERLRNLFQALDLNDDEQYEKHIARQKQIRDDLDLSYIKRMPTEEEQDKRDEISMAKVKARKSGNFIQKLQTHDGIGNAVIYIQNGVEIKREYPWGTDAENTLEETV